MNPEKSGVQEPQVSRVQRVFLETQVRPVTQVRGGILDFEVNLASRVMMETQVQGESQDHQVQMANQGYREHKEPPVTLGNRAREVNKDREDRQVIQTFLSV